MAFIVRDLSEECLRYLCAPSPTEAFLKWVEAQEPEVLAGFAALGVFAQPERTREGVQLVARHRDEIRRFVSTPDWHQGIAAGLRMTSITLAQVGPDVRLYVLIGPGRSNASAAVWQGHGLAFVWLENWLGASATGELQDLDVRALAPMVSHELAHAIRYGLPGTHSPMGQPALPRPADLWAARLALPLREVIYDEGLATRFSLDAFPQLSAAEALFMNAEQIAWLDRHWQRLIHDRERRWKFDEPNPPFAALVDAVTYEPGRMHPPWTMDRPPAKWGYYVGLKWAEGATGNWAARLGSACPPVHALMSVSSKRA